MPDLYLNNHSLIANRVAKSANSTFSSFNFRQYQQLVVLMLVMQDEMNVLYLISTSTWKESIHSKLSEHRSLVRTCRGTQIIMYFGYIHYSMTTLHPMEQFHFTSKSNLI